MRTQELAWFLTTAAVAAGLARVLVLGLIRLRYWKRDRSWARGRAEGELRRLWQEKHQRGKEH